jgi:hypothetical protein
VIDNRASRFVGGIVARATPDGYTLVVGGGTMQFVPLMEKADFDLLTDFAPISQLERSPNVLVVHPSLKVNTVKDGRIARSKSPCSTAPGACGSLTWAGDVRWQRMSKFLVPYRARSPHCLAC